MRLLYSLLLPLIALATSCAPTRFVEPVAEHHYAVVASLGGPLITYSDLTIPMPLTALTAGYGYSQDLTVFGSLHTTALLFKDLQVDAGILQRLLDQDGLRPGISVSPVANFVIALRDGRAKFWPELDANLHWHYDHSGNLAYAGSTNWFELSATRAHDEPQEHHWIPSIQIGHIFDGDNWQYTTELKYLAVGISNVPNVVEYHGIAEHGGLAVYLALTRKF